MTGNEMLAVVEAMPVGARTSFPVSAITTARVKRISDSEWSYRFVRDPKLAAPLLGKHQVGAAEQVVYWGMILGTWETTEAQKGA